MASSTLLGVNKTVSNIRGCSQGKFVSTITELLTEALQKTAAEARWPWTCACGEGTVTHSTVVWRQLDLIVKGWRASLLQRLICTNGAILYSSLNIPTSNVFF